MRHFPSPITLYISILHVNNTIKCVIFIYAHARTVYLNKVRFKHITIIYFSPA